MRTMRCNDIDFRRPVQLCAFLSSFFCSSTKLYVFMEASRGKEVDDILKVIQLI